MIDLAGGFVRQVFAAFPYARQHFVVQGQVCCRDAAVAACDPATAVCIEHVQKNVHLFGNFIHTFRNILLPEIQLWVLGVVFGEILRHNIADTHGIAVIILLVLGDRITGQCSYRNNENYSDQQQPDQEGSPDAEPVVAFFSTLFCFFHGT